MRILILSFYFPPDLSAGSFRVKALVDALRAEGDKTLRIDVITTLPNRYLSHNTSAPEAEEVGGVRIRRIVLPIHRSGRADQAKAFASFARQALAETRGQRWDLVVATSSRLMTAVLGAGIASRSRAPLYLDIRDLFTDTMSDLLSSSFLRHLMPVFRWLEMRTFMAAKRLNVVSAGFLPYAKAIAPAQNYRNFTNGIDDVFLYQDFEKPTQALKELPLVVYAGNIGEGQGLHKVLPLAARLMVGKARFRLIGDGGRRLELEQAINQAGLNNVEILNAVPRSELFEHYRQADVMFLHLNDHKAFHKVLPSKLFEYAATGKPILAGVAGYPAEFLLSQVPGVEVFAPCDARGMVTALERLLGHPKAEGRIEFCRKYAREAIMREMARDVLAAGAGT
jgi:glycosyltransferase involved in cell wall biosynthesis